ncbi:MAG: hypothetical protein JW745_00510 [Sedimentisphaerales bacterium]|nr:hypothetical protein [Sedimentisphaerales bacterium]MBN2843340.1 hypothetical protein [Sedimentisphaerales bacterium]
MLVLKCMVMLFVVMSLGGCGVVRLAPSQVQKQNAWLLYKTTAAIHQQSQQEQASEQLSDLAQLAQMQSQAVVSDYGMPESVPASDIESLLDGNAGKIADEAIAQSELAVSGSAWLDVLVVIISLISGAAGGQYLGAGRRRAVK